MESKSQTSVGLGKDIQEVQKVLIQKEYTHALKLSTTLSTKIVELYGKTSPEAITCYILLARANMGLNRFKQTEEFLSQANWNIVQSKEPLDSLRAQVFETYGRLYCNQKRFDESLQQLSNAAYCYSISYGPEDAKTSKAFFYLGNSFYSMKKTENSLALYDKVVDIWYKFMANVKEISHEERNKKFDDVLSQEAISMLESILDVRVRLLGSSHIATGEVKYTLGLIYLYTGNHVRAHQSISDAIDIYNEHLGPEHPSTKDVQIVLTQLNNAVLM